MPPSTNSCSCEPKRKLAIPTSGCDVFFFFKILWQTTPIGILPPPTVRGLETKIIYSNAGRGIIKKEIEQPFHSLLQLHSSSCVSTPTTITTSTSLLSSCVHTCLFHTCLSLLISLAIRDHVCFWFGAGVVLNSLKTNHFNTATTFS